MNAIANETKRLFSGGQPVAVASQSFNKYGITAVKLLSQPTDIHINNIS